MAVSPNYRVYVEDQLGRVFPLRSQPMFGGVGLYAGDVFFALIDDDTLYFKVDEITRPRYEARGSGPFHPYGEVSMSYYRVPDGVLDDLDELGTWAVEALEVARRAVRKKRRA